MRAKSINIDQTGSSFYTKLTSYHFIFQTYLNNITNYKKSIKMVELNIIKIHNTVIVQAYNCICAHGIVAKVQT